MLTTPNLSLKKPEGTDIVDIADLNSNMDILDAAVTAKETPAGAQTKVDTHANRTDNPHSVAAAQVGAIPTTAKGAANGVASLDAGGKVPSSQLPATAASPRTATIVVAASDSSAAGKASADYVCTGTGDQTVINNAITALGTNAGKVVLLEGLFSVAAAISLPNNVSLEGQGNGTILQVPSGSTLIFSVIQNADTTNGNSGLSVSNLKIDGNKANLSVGVTQHGISFTKVTYSTVQNVDVINIRNNGINLSGSTYNTVIGNSCQGNNSIGIQLVSTSNNNTVIGNSCQGNGSSGIDVDSSSNNTVSGNTCQGNGFYGIELNGSLSKFNAVTGNTCQGNGFYGISISGAAYNTVTGNTCQGNSLHGIVFNAAYKNTVTGNTCSGNTQTGIDISTSSNNTVTGNTCQGNGTNGILLTSSSSGNTISGNTCVENSQTTHNTSDNIFVDGTSSTNNIQGNTCRQGTLTNKPRYGIRVNVAGCTGNLITNNDLTTSGATGAFSDVGTGTVTTAGNKLA